MLDALSVRVAFHKGAWWIFTRHNGKRKAKRIGEKATADTVAKTLRQRHALGDFGVLAIESSDTLKTYADRWLTEGEAQRKASTQRFYEFNLRLHILPILGGLQVASLKRRHVRELLADCQRKQLKPASLRGVNRTLSAVLSQAVDDELLQANPAFRMGKHLRGSDDEAPEDVRPLTRDDARRLLEAARADFPEWYPFFLCAVRTGMRLGELLALQWADLNLDERYAEVRRAIVAGRLTSPKNRQRRRVDLSRALVDELRALRVRSNEAALRAGRKARWVFCSAAGEPRDADNMRNRVFYRLLEKTGLDLRFHDLRHTFASHLIQNGESLAYVRDQLGHSSIQVTVDIYGHLVPSANRAAVDRLDTTTNDNPVATDPPKPSTGEAGK